MLTQQIKAIEQDADLGQTLVGFFQPTACFSSAGGDVFIFAFVRGKELQAACACSLPAFDPAPPVALGAPTAA